jgi:hypothetical protein
MVTAHFYFTFWGMVLSEAGQTGNASDSGDEADSDHDDKLEDGGDYTAKLRDSDTIWQDPDIKSRVLTGKFRITKILTVDRIEYLNDLPSIWPVSQIPTAYVVDLDTRHGDIDPESGRPDTLDFLIRNHVSSPALATASPVRCTGQRFVAEQQRQGGWRADGGF